MQDLNDLYYFSMVVEKGGFAAAGRALDIPKSRLSRRIAQLEERLAVRLIQRSTRKFAVTDAGQNFYRHCQAMLAEAQAAEDAVAHMTSEPRGLIRVSCPVSITQNVMSRILPDFLERFPQVRVLLLSTNRRIDLINENVDIAIRVRSKLDTDADLVVRSFGISRALLVAHPRYLDANGRPDVPDDLRTLQTIGIEENETQTWELVGPNGATFHFEHQPRVMCGDFPLALSAAVRKMGVAFLPETVCATALANGDLEVILPQWSLPQGIVHCVYPSRRGLLPAARAMIDWLVEHLPCTIESRIEGI